MNDARISTALPGHPKTKKLIRRLGEGAGWKLVCLFLWAAANRPDGDLEGMSSEDIELAVDWTGDNDAFVRELVAVGFLDGEEGSYTIHDWAEHNPWVSGSGTRSAKGRWNAIKRHYGEAEADRQVPEWAAIRCTKDAGSNASSNARSTKTDAGSNAPSPSPSPYPYPYPKQASTAPPTEAATPPPAKPPTDAGRACLLMRKAGCTSTNPSHPDLLAALAEGVTPEALGDTAREGIDLGRSKPFAWAIATARARQREGAAPIPDSHPNSTPSRSGTGPAKSKTLQGIERLEALKNAARNEELVPDRDRDGPAKALPPVA